MKRLKGLFTDCHPRDQPEGTYRDARNTVINNKLGSHTNEKGTTSLFTVPATNIIIGSIAVKDKTVLFSYSQVGSDEIGIWDGNNYTQFITSNALNFSNNSYVTGEFTQNKYGETVIIFVDGTNPIRTINLSKSYSIDSNNIGSLNLIPNIDSYVTESHVITEGGSLKTGAYQIFIEYEIEDESTTNTYQLTDWIPISDADGDNPFKVTGYKGSKGNDPTSKQIQLELSNFPSQGVYFRLYCVFRAENQIQRVVKFDRQICEDGVVNIYSLDDAIDSSLDELLIDSSIYNTAKAITKVGDQFYFGNVTKKIDVGYQKYANNIKVELAKKSLAGPVTEDFKTSFRDEEVIQNFKSYRRGGVYALYVSLLLKTGQETVAYHIPGRSSQQLNGEISVDFGAPLGTNNYSQTTSNLHVGDVIANQTITFAFVDHNGSSSTFDINVTSGETFDVVAGYIQSNFSHPSFTLDVIPHAGYMEIQVRATSYGSFYDGAYLQCITNYGSISGGSGNAATNNTSNGLLDTDNVSDTFSIVGEDDVTVTFPAGSSSTVIAQAIKDQLDTDIADFTFTINGSVVSTEEEGFDPSISVNGSGASYSFENAVDETGEFERGNYVVDYDEEITAKRFQFLTDQDETYQMGYWENQNEQYPNTDDFLVINIADDGTESQVASLKQSNVRHHHFPDYLSERLHDGSNAFSLGFKLKDLKIPDSLKDDVVGIKVYRAEHKGNNRLILGQGSLYMMRKVDKSINGTTRTFHEPAANVYSGYPLQKVYQTFDHHLIRTKESIGSLSHIVTHGITTTLNEYEELGDITDVKDDGISDSDSSPDIYTHIDGVNNPINQFNEAIERVEAKSYIEHDSFPVNVTPLGFEYDINNQDGNSSLAIRLNDTLSDSLGVSIAHGSFNAFRTDVYRSFYNQQLVWTGFIDTDVGKYKPSNESSYETSDIFGGDTCIVNHFYLISTEKNNTAHQMNMFHELVESYDNIEMKYEGDNVTEVFYPKTNAIDVIKPPSQDLNFDLGSVDNWLGYSEEYGASLPTSKPTIAYNPYQSSITSFPRRIIRTLGTTKQYRSFKEFDFSELDGPSGDITNLENLNNLLFIHTEDGLYRTYGQEELQVADVRAFLGTGDIFSRKPQEIYQNNTGYAGVLSAKHGLMTKYGYVFVSSEDKTIYMVSDGLKEISSLGIREETRDLIDQENENGFDVKLGYDPDNDRILITIGQQTYSFLPKQNIWVSKHDYVPNSYIPHRNKFISVKENIAYQHNKGNPNIFYGTNYNWMIEFVDNTQQNVNKEAIHIGYEHVIKNPSDNYLLDETLSWFQIYNSYQDSGQTDIVYFKGANALPNGNARPVKNKWTINRFRDMLEGGVLKEDLPWHKQSRLRDTYFIVRLGYTSNINSLYLFDTYVAMAKSEI